VTHHLLLLLLLLWIWPTSACWLWENTSTAHSPWLAVWCQHRQHLQLVHSIVVL
jgi:hypothetical protein